MRLIYKLVALAFLVLSPMSVGALAQESGCQPAPPSIVGAITFQLKYYDVWLQGATAYETYEFGERAWIISADVGGPEFESNSDMAHWVATSLDSSAALIYKLDKGHAEYLSDSPNGDDFGYDVGFLSEALGNSRDCAMDAANQTGSLGVESATWADRHGDILRTTSGFISADGKMVFITAEDRIISVKWTFDSPMLARDARALSRDLIPDDALMAGASSEGPRQVFNQPDIYTSDWLSDRFENGNVWRGAEAGTLSVTFNDGQQGYVGSITVKLGMP